MPRQKIADGLESIYWHITWIRHTLSWVFQCIYELYLTSKRAGSIKLPMINGPGSPDSKSPISRYLGCLLNTSIMIPFNASYLLPKFQSPKSYTTAHNGRPRIMHFWYKWAALPRVKKSNFSTYLKAIQFSPKLFMLGHWNFTGILTRSCSNYI